MGQEIDQEEFSAADYAQFAAQVQRDLGALELVLARPGFGAGETTIGVELEVNLIDDEARPLPLNQAVLATADDARVKLELDRFNLEVNGCPQPLRGRPFGQIGAELSELLDGLRQAARKHAGRIAVIGILPTLRLQQLLAEALTDAARYRAMAAGLRRLRQGPLQLHIDGNEPLTLEWDELTFEGANTSLQVHLRVAAADFADMYNAAQLAAGPVLACAGNSPLFLGHRLWRETRIALFRQAVEDRVGSPEPEWRPARVSFGHGWVRRSAIELFAESAWHHPPLLPVVSEEAEPVAVARSGAVPELRALRLHHGTLWRWNRAVYDPHGAGHLRIELRSLPAGPTVTDMLANAAFALGLTLGLRPRIGGFLNALTFGQARRNFYAAARDGLDAELLWPAPAAPSPQPMRAADLIEHLLPLARAGLLAAGVEAAEADPLLAVIAARTQSRQTGASWQLRTLAALEREMPRPKALAVMLERYLACADTGAAVHSWPAPADAT
jgi:gamma-glutamyl:cysteine ligase YbdK (ATP-grasp superfamily)